jgi:hypothetical protein
MKRPHPATVARLGLVILVAIGVPSCDRLVKPGAGKTIKAPDPAGTTVGKGLLAAVPQRPALPAGWQEVKHPEGVFRIYVPGIPVRPKNTHESLKLGQALQQLEARESVHEASSTTKPPLLVHLEFNLFHPSGRAAFRAFEVGSRERVMPAGWTIKSDRAVTWGDLPATEMIVEKTFPGLSPRRFYSIARWAVCPDRLYNFSLEQEDRMPSDADRAAFFDSFVPGN